LSSAESRCSCKIAAVERRPRVWEKRREREREFAFCFPMGKAHRWSLSHLTCSLPQSVPCLIPSNRESYPEVIGPFMSHSASLQKLSRWSNWTTYATTATTTMTGLSLEVLVKTGRCPDESHLTAFMLYAFSNTRRFSMGGRKRLRHPPRALISMAPPL
jgi:hypothetical protein